MKYLPILLLILLSCTKQVTDNPAPLVNDFITEWVGEKPAFKISVWVTGNQVTVNWDKKGRNKYMPQRKIGDVWTDLFSSPCECGQFIETLPAGDYPYRVLSYDRSGGLNGTSGIVVGSVASAPTPPTPGQTRVIKIAFDPYYVSYWNAFLSDTTLLGSGLEQWRIDTIMNRVRTAFAGYNVVFVHEGEADQTCVVTRSSSWYGSVGGVAFLGSFYQDKECFVFSELLYYNTNNISKAIIHELGHTLNLRHTLDLSLSDNWMAYAYTYWMQYFYTVMDNVGNLVNQPLVIQNMLQ